LNSASVHCRCPDEPFGFAYPIEVPDFGRIYLWTDGKHLSHRAMELLLERELAHSRYQRSLAFVKQYQRKGVPFETAQAHLERAKPPTTDEDESLQRSLRESLLGGEEAALAVARVRIQRIGWREAFLWGIRLTDPIPSIDALHPPFNQLSLSMAEHPIEAWEPIVQQAQQERLLLRGESLITLASIQQALESPLPLQESLINRMRHTMTYYRGRIRYWEILSDLPDSLALLADEPKSRLALVATLCEAARAVDFGIVRLLGATYGLHTPRAVYDLLEQMVDNDVPFEGVNLHLDWRDFDMLDFDDLLEQYGNLGKPLHLSLHLPPTCAKSANPFYWRTPPSESNQADWLLHAFTIALSKPFVVGVQVAQSEIAESTIQRLNAQRQAWKCASTP
jgi:hypothetical protein